GCAAFSPDGTWLVTGGEVGKPGAATVWGARTGRPPLALKRLKGGGRCAAVSPDGTRIVTGGGKAMVWDARTGAPLVELNGPKERVSSGAFSPDGTRIVTAAAAVFGATELKVWDARTGTALLDLTLKDKTGSVSMGEEGGCVAFSPDGRRFVAGGMYTRSIHPWVVQVWDAETGTVL